MKVTVIIPNYNGSPYMEHCLASPKEQTFKDFQILVVDNGSTDGSIACVRENCPDARVIALDKNYGFSKAVNVGIRHSKTPYVILLNNDTKADPHYIEEMVKAIERSPRIFSVSSKMIQMYHPDLIDSAGDLYTLTGWGVCRGVGRPVSNYVENDQVFSVCRGFHLPPSGISEDWFIRREPFCLSGGYRHRIPRQNLRIPEYVLPHCAGLSCRERDKRLEV